MSQKLSLIIALFLLLILPACEFSPPVTEQPPSATESPSPAPPTEVTAITDTPPPPNETDSPPPPTLTPTASPTNPPFTPTFTSTFTPTPTATEAPYPYAIQEGCPVYMPNFAHLDAGCDWLGVAGHVFDANQEVIANLVVVAGGTLGGNPIDMLTMTGMSTDYGQGAYELVLSSTVVASEGSVWIQVLGLDGQPITPKVYLDTSEDCLQNLILLNFVQVGE